MTKTATLPRLNAMIAKIVPHTELVRGEGYHYVVFDDGVHFDTLSIMVPYTSHMTAQRWIDDAVAFARSQMQQALR
jgi:hypothetical protein